MAAFMGRDGYRRQAFAVKPGPEAAFLIEEMALSPGATVADVGCGTGRHLPYWRAAGLRAIGLDLSIGFGPPVVGDALRLPLADQSVDGAVALCGVAGAVPLGSLVKEMQRVARHVVAVAAFSLPFARRHLPGALDGRRIEEVVRVPNGRGQWREFVHCHECYEPDELPGRVYGVEPGTWSRAVPSTELPELLGIWRAASS